MKINPIAQGSGQPGQALNAVNAGRTTDPIKMERARAIAQGKKVEEIPETQEQKERPNVRKIVMRTQRSPDRLEAAVEPAPEAPLVDPAPETEQKEPLSSTPDAGEQANIEDTKPLSPQFAALAKQRRALQLERAELDKQKAELAAQSNGVTAEQLISKLKSSPLSVLQEHGVTYDQLTEEILNGHSGINPEIQALKDEIKALKEGVDKSFQSKEAQQEEAALTEMLYQAEALAKDGDAYELIREQDAYDQVLRLIHSTYKKTGRVLDVSQAMEQVETKLLSNAEKLARLKKVQGKIQPSEPNPPLQPQQRQMRTLTARDSSMGSMSARQRAIAAFNGTLKR